MGVVRGEWAEQQRLKREQEERERLQKIEIEVNIYVLVYIGRVLLYTEAESYCTQKWRQNDTMNCGRGQSRDGHWEEQLNMREQKIAEKRNLDIHEMFHETGLICEKHCVSHVFSQIILSV